MTDVFLPSSVNIARIALRYIDSTGISKNPFTGAVRTVSLLGDRLGATIELTSAGGRGSTSGLQDRARILQFIVRLQGQQGRAYLYDPSYVQRGSFPSAELLPNGEFTNGLTGYSGGASWAQAVTDNVLRATRTQAGAGSALAVHGSVTVTQYAPHVMRYATVLGPGLDETSTWRVEDSGLAGGTAQAWQGVLSAIVVPPSTSLSPRMVNQTPVAIPAGSIIDILYASMSRCALVDNFPNALLQSDNITTSWTNARSTDSANTTANFDGTTTADSLIEDATASATHYIQQSSTKSAVAEDWCGVAFLKANTRTQAAVQIGESGTNFARIIVNLSTGAVLSAAAAAGTVTNARGFVRDMGNGWYAISIVATMPTTITTTNSLLILMASGGSTSYSGDGSSSIFVGRGGYAASSVPFFPSLTTTSALASGTAQSGNRLNVKALPVSTAGLFLAGDQVEILTSYGSELKIVREQLDSDASGLGTLIFAPRLRGIASDGAAVIACRPMGRFVSAGNTNMEMTTDPGIISGATFEFEEAVG